MSRRALALLTSIALCSCQGARAGDSCTVFYENHCEGNVAVGCSGGNGDRRIWRQDCRAEGKVCRKESQNAFCVSAR
jgi:hypothetical protein